MIGNAYSTVTDYMLWIIAAVVGITFSGSTEAEPDTFPDIRRMRSAVK